MTDLLLSSIYLDFDRFLDTNFTQQSSSFILTDFCYQSIKIIWLQQIFNRYWFLSIDYSGTVVVIMRVMIILNKSRSPVKMSWQLLILPLLLPSLQLDLVILKWKTHKFRHLPPVTLVILPTIFLQLFDWAAKDGFWSRSRLVSSSETQGQILGTRESLNGRENVAQRK